MYEKSIGNKMKDLDLCLKVVSRSVWSAILATAWLLVLHLTFNISEPVRERGLVPNDHQKKMGYQMVTWPMTPRDLENSIRDPNIH